MKYFLERMGKVDSNPFRRDSKRQALCTLALAVVGNKGKPLGTSVESQCEFEGV